MNAKPVCSAFRFCRLARVIVTLGMILGYSTGTPAQKETGALRSSAYSVGEEIPLLNQNMSLTVRAEALGAGSMELLCINHTVSGAIKITLSLNNKGPAPVDWEVYASPRAKDSEVTLLLNGLKEVAPVAWGIAGKLSTNKTGPGETTSHVLLFSKPIKISNSTIRIRQTKSGLREYAPLFPKEGILVNTGLQDNK